MASASDIPDHFKAPDQKPAFIEWVLELAIDFHTAKSLVHLWALLTRTSLTHGEWQDLEAKHKAKVHA